MLFLTKMITSLIIALVLVPLLRGNGGNSAFYACEGMVVSAHPLASEAGLQLLQDGGNAFDAAIATEFALAVVFPVAGNLGGGGFAVVRAADGTIETLDYREQSPAAATRDMYLDADGKPIDQLSTRGAMAVGIPGTVDGMYRLHQKYGSKPWPELLAPAIRLARRGWPLTVKEVALLNRHLKELTEENGSSTYLTRRKQWQAGDSLFAPQLATTLERIAQNGRDGFYRGPVADSLLALMRWEGGLIDSADLDNYRARWRPSLSFRWQEYEFHSMGPPSSGGILLGQMWQMAHQYPIDKRGRNNAEAIEILIEAERRAYADRSRWLGDPDFVNVPTEALLAPDYLRKRMSSYTPEHATPSKKLQPGKPLPESDQTTHYCIADGQGNFVSATTSLNGAYGCKLIVPGAGFLLNNTMDDFSIAPGIPNSYGLVGSEANAVAPGKRMLSSMTPTLVLKNQQPYLLTGTPGGSTIPTTVLQVLLNVIDYQMDMQMAVSLPRFHHQWLPDEVRYESGRFNKTQLRRLKAHGYKTTQRDPWGRSEGIRILPDGTLEGGADPRGDDTVLGY